MKVKMRLEDKIRKDRREMKIAEVRKLLLATPARKRDRKESGSQALSCRMPDRPRCKDDTKEDDPDSHEVIHGAPDYRGEEESSQNPL
jgi:hypothetical protein